MAGSMRSMVCTLSLVFAVVYVFAIAFRQLSIDTPLETQYFRSVPAAISKLLLAATAPDQMGMIEDFAHRTAAAPHHWEPYPRVLACRRA